MNIEKYKIEYSKLKVGDKLWSIQLGQCKVVSIKPVETHTFPVICGMRAETTSYTDDGKLGRADAFPSLFTSNPFADTSGRTATFAYIEESGPINQDAFDRIHQLMDEAKRPSNPESILQEAERLINGDRREAYGDAKENFGDIAKGWSVLFKTHVTAEQVAIAMIWLKMCRFNHKEGRDSIVDIAGYAGCLEKIMKGGTK